MLVAILGCSDSPDEGAHVGGGDEAGAGGSDAGGAGGTTGAPTVGGSSSGGTFPMPEGGSGGGASEYEEQNLIEMRIEPVGLELPDDGDPVLSVALGQSKQVAYKAFGRYASKPDEEIELTERTVFYVPDNYLVASFPADGGNTLSTRLPANADDAQQRGGTLTIQAQAANTDGTVTTVTTALQVVLTGSVPVLVPDELDLELDPVPDDAASDFVGTPTPARAPVLAYPNDGVLLPPNLGQLEVHFERGAPENELFQVQFQSDNSTITYYTRCFSDPLQFEEDACAISISGAAFENLAQSNQGVGPVQLTVRGSDEDGTFGESATFEIEFAAERIDGAVYYWTTSNQSSIMRFDFGSGQADPETFVSNGSVTSGNKCVGCHALSRQGDKAFFSLGSSNDGALMYIDDMSLDPALEESYAFYGVDDASNNRVLTGSFNPDGSKFVAVAPEDEANEQKLIFHDGTSGVRESTLSLPFVPSAPDWSPDGDAIAMTRVTTNAETISFLGGGISLIKKSAGQWDGDHPVTVVAPAAGKNNFNPTFTPDGALLLYTQVDQATYSPTGAWTDACEGTGVLGDPGRYCNGYSDPGARTWAVAPSASAVPALLAKAAQPGVGDELHPPPQPGVGGNALMDTFPKAAPFVISHRGKDIGWFTVGSQRRAGLRKTTPQNSVVQDPVATQSLLWMFALDSDAVLAGNDGSYPGFFLPFQDLATSNHMAQWTQRIVSAEPPPPAPVPPPPAPPPAPPPPPVILR